MEAYDKVGVAEVIKEGEKVGLLVGVYDGLGVVLAGTATVEPLSNVTAVPANA
jgi:hypothetical protein